MNSLLLNIIMNKKYDNNNIIIASRAYFLQWALLVLNHSQLPVIAESDCAQLIVAITWTDSWDTKYPKIGKFLLAD
jgi:hypothetical protein